MANMSYCRFENTFRDLQDCKEALSDINKDLSESEEKYRKYLVELCKQIAHDFGEDNDD